MIFKKILSFLAVANILLLTSCTFPGEYVSKKDNKKKIEAVMELIKNEKKDELIEQFSSELQNHCYEDLMTEIERMYSYLDGKIVSYDEPESCGYSQETVDYGDIKLYRSSPDVKNVKTENGQELSFLFSYTVIDDENPENVGITQIRIYTQKENGGLDEMQLNIDGNIID